MAFPRLGRNGLARGSNGDPENATKILRHSAAGKLSITASPLSLSSSTISMPR
jgi:hypothetical protein